MVAALRILGMAPQKAQSAVPGSLLSRVGKQAPPAFMKLGFATHSEIIGNCVACHATYRLPEPR